MMATTRRDFGNMILSDIFKCKKREGPQGTRCSNCGGDHTTTEEYLRTILDARIIDLTNKILQLRNNDEECKQLTGALEEIKRLLK